MNFSKVFWKFHFLIMLHFLFGRFGQIEGHDHSREFNVAHQTNVARMRQRNDESVSKYYNQGSRKRVTRDVRIFTDYGTIDGPCRSFIEGDAQHQTFTTPLNEDNKYPSKVDCVRVIEAPRNHIIQLDFREYFEMEQSTECKFDYLEVRDGGHGYSDLIGFYCGTGFPDMITSSGRFLWLHFHSDESIEMRGFKAVYNFSSRPTNIPPEVDMCEIPMSGPDGILNVTDIPEERRQMTKNFSVPLDCIWAITVKEGWKIQLTFTKYKLARPNECDKNFIDVFTNRTDLPSRLKNFCGSISDGVSSKSNIMFIRFFAQPMAINSTFEALFTATRDRGDAKGNCEADEFDCQDNFCIDETLRCNTNINCRYRWDETDCVTKKKDVAEHIIIIICVFCLIVTGMCAAFLFNCIRKLMRDHRLIQEHLRQSRENRLDQIKPHKKKSVDLKKSQISLIVPPPTITQMPLPPIESMQNVRRSPSNSISSSQGFKMPTNYQQDSRQGMHQDLMPILKDNSTGTLSCDDLCADALPEMCDMACQTRESLFQTPQSRTPSGYGWKASPGSSSPSDVSCPHPPYRAEVAIELKDSPTPPKHRSQRPYSVQTTKSAPDVIVTH